MRKKNGMTSKKPHVASMRPVPFGTGDVVIFVSIDQDDLTPTNYGRSAQ